MKDAHNGYSTGEHSRRPVVLVTGGDVPMRSAVATEIVRRDALPVVLCEAPEHELATSASDQVELEQGSASRLSDLVRIAKRHEVTRLIHLPDPTSTWEADRLVAEYDASRARVINIFELAELLDVRRVVYPSSVHVFGDARNDTGGVRHVVNESDPMRPTTLRGASDLLVETTARLFGRAHGIEMIGLRSVLTVAPGDISESASLIDQALVRAVTGKQGVIHAPWEPASRVNVMYGRDAATLFVATCLHDHPFQLPVYNMGTGEYLSVLDMIETANLVLAAPGAVTYDKAAPTCWPGHLDFPDADSRALRHALGWHPAYTFEEAVREAGVNYAYRAFTGNSSTGR